MNNAAVAAFVVALALSLLVSVATFQHHGLVWLPPAVVGAVWLASSGLLEWLPAFPFWLMM